VHPKRNITRTYRYFHDGLVWGLRDATQVMARVQLGREISETVMDNLIAFYNPIRRSRARYGHMPWLSPCCRSQPSKPLGQVIASVSDSTRTASVRAP
jgi:cytochrome c peroxidase